MAKALTSAAIERFKPEPVRREIPDGLLTGLYLIVQPTGRKSWAVRYRFHGQQRKVTLGAYPVLDLSAARDRAKAILLRVQSGEDPALSKRTAEANSFDAAARSFLLRYAKPKNRSWRETARLIGYIPNAPGDDDPSSFGIVKGSPADQFRHRDVKTITRGEIKAELDRIADRGAPFTANRTLAALRKMFNWAIAQELASKNPCIGQDKLIEEASRTRVLTDDELRAFLKGCDAIGQPFGPLFKLLLLTGQRRDEVAAMPWGEIDGDVWVIPKERVKNKNEHAVPLSSAAMAILEAMPRIDGAAHVFTTNGASPVSGFSRAKANLDKKMLEILRAAGERDADPDEVSLPDWRLHDLRRTTASGMARLNIPLPVIERVLNHISGSFAGVAGIYNRYDFLPEKRSALEAWANFIAALDKPVENVIPLDSRASV